jgi:hypothetical protein
MTTTGKETEKAIQIKSEVYMEVAPIGGFTSSLIKDRTGSWTFWCPKSVYSDGKPADWFIEKKAAEAKEFYENKFFNAQILNVKLY